MAKIAEMTLFATPESVTDLMARIEALSSDEKQTAMLFAMMAWNLCAKLTNENEGE